MCECMCVMVCLAVVCLCGENLWCGTIRYDWIVSHTALGLSNCLGPPGYLDRSTLDPKQIM